MKNTKSKEIGKGVSASDLEFKEFQGSDLRQIASEAAKEGFLFFCYCVKYPCGEFRVLVSKPFTIH